MGAGRAVRRRLGEAGGRWGGGRAVGRWVLSLDFDLLFPVGGWGSGRRSRNR